MKTLVLISGVMLSGAVIGGTLYYFRNEKRKVRQAAQSQIRSRILELIRKKGLSEEIQAILHEEFSEDESLISGACQDVFLLACDKVTLDGVIEPKEMVYLNKLAAAIGLSGTVINELLLKSKTNRLKDEALTLLAKGVFSQNTVQQIQQLKQSLILNSTSVSDIARQNVTDAYVALFRKVIEDGRITPEELAELDSFQKAMGLTKKQANSIIRDDALKLYRQWFINITQDGEITPEEEKGLAWLRDEFGLDTSEIQGYEREMVKIRSLASYRKGQLPRLQTSKMLESGEICHWESDCTYTWSTPSQTKSSSGELMITSNKIVFMSAGKSFSFSPSTIVDIEEYTKSVVIRTSVNKGSGKYSVSDPQFVEAILAGC